MALRSEPQTPGALPWSYWQHLSAQHSHRHILLACLLSTPNYQKHEGKAGKDQVQTRRAWHVPSATSVHSAGQAASRSRLQVLLLHGKVMPAHHAKDPEAKKLEGKARACSLATALSCQSPLLLLPQHAQREGLALQIPNSSIGDAQHAASCPACWAPAEVLHTRCPNYRQLQLRNSCHR